MKAKAQEHEAEEAIAAWPLPYSATLGSSLRAQGIFLHVRALLPLAARKSLAMKARELTLRMPAGQVSGFSDASSTIARALDGIESRPVIPREIEDILAIKSSERHRWLKDGRLKSAGTRTVKLRGRARKVTFHVFDPRVVEDILDRDLVERWREEDAERTAEKRRLAAWKGRLTRARKKDASQPPENSQTEEDRFKLRGWAEFERENLLS